MSTATHSDGREPARIVAATRLEYWAARIAAGGGRVERVGVGFTCVARHITAKPVIACGLAGALVPDLAPGAILIPLEVALTDGSRFACDPQLHRRLVDAARSLGHEPRTEPILTAPGLVTGRARAEWAERGFIAADMESGHLARLGVPFATVRAVLDTPAREISEQWLGTAALLRPALWVELVWMAYRAPRYALIAARVATAAVAGVGPPNTVPAGRRTEPP
ncbi:MAG TPA: hypothetical protein VKX16_18215 [Chloroflexota bacterium]|nr:hypothetical protein [Chloroflexota bacterium]